MRPEVSASLKWRCWSGCHNLPKKSCWHRCCSSAFCISFFRFLSPPFCSACANCCCSPDRRATSATATRGGFGKCGRPITRERSGIAPGPANATAFGNASVRRRSRIERGLLVTLAPRSGLWFQQLPKTEVVALELRIPHFAVAAEVDAIKAAAETLDVAVGEQRRELREHRTPQLEPFVSEIAAGMGVVNHHPRPGAGDEGGA